MRLFSGFVALCVAVGSLNAIAGVPYNHQHYKGAKRAHIVDYPYMVSIQTNNNDDGDFQHFCGGTLIKSDHVLTAAHCVPFWMNPSNVRVVAGIDSLKQLWSAEIAKVAEFIVHPDYLGGVNPNDVAILRLQYLLNTTTIASLPSSPGVSLDDAILIGWEQDLFGGLHKNMHKTKLPVISYSDCFDAVFMQTNDASQLSEISNMCTANVNGHVCPGDSGGPLIQNGVVVGIASWISGYCGDTNGIAVFTRVDSFLDFIHTYNN